jgi:hypothetical protein
MSEGARRLVSRIVLSEALSRPPVRGANAAAESRVGGGGGLEVPGRALLSLAYWDELSRDRTPTPLLTLLRRRRKTLLRIYSYIP